MEVGTSSVLKLPYTASSVGVARRRLVGDLTAAGVHEATACDAGLVLSELISNALRHAAPLPDATVRVAWRLNGDCVEIAVSDGGGPTVPEVNEPGSSAIGGRGLGIVERLSLRWGIYPSADGAGEMTVWAELALNAENEHADMGHPHARVANAAHVHRSGEPGLVIASSRDA
jgi:anti-sigma regulatory factor (Ser/Thr protein kinase)